MFPLICAVGMVAGALLGSGEGPALLHCRAAIRHGEATIEIAQTHRVRDPASGSPHVCRAEVNVAGPDGQLRRVFADIDPVGGRYGVAILPEAIGGYRAVAKLGEYDGRLLLVGTTGVVVDLPGPAHALAYGRFPLVEHRSDVYAIVVFDVTAGDLVFSADAAVLTDLLGRELGDPARWVEMDDTLYLWPPSAGRAESALRLDRRHGGLVPARVSADDAARARPVRFRGLEAWQDCSCGGTPGPSPGGTRGPVPG